MSEVGRRRGFEYQQVRTLRGAAILVAFAVIGVMGCGSPAPPANVRDPLRSETVLDARSRYVAAGQDLDAALREMRLQPTPWILRLGPGEHRFSTPILLPSGSSLVGTGVGLTSLRPRTSMATMVSNDNLEHGNESINLSGLTLNCADRAERGIFFIRVASLVLENLEISDCRGEGGRISGHGEITRNIRISHVTANRNRGDGLVFMWAIRNVQYTDVSANFNGGQGVVFDHSEFQASNVSACDNAGNGVYLRNFFAADIRGVYACRNGRHGILIEGMVASVGSGWVAQSNGRTQPETYDDIHFSAREDLSYGVSRDSFVSGLSVGSYDAGYGPPTSRYGLYFEAGVEWVAVEGLVAAPTLSGPYCRGCMPEL